MIFFVMCLKTNDEFILLNVNVFDLGSWSVCKGVSTLDSILYPPVSMLDSIYSWFDLTWTTFPTIWCQFFNFKFVSLKRWLNPSVIISYSYFLIHFWWDVSILIFILSYFINNLLTLKQSVERYSDFIWVISISFLMHLIYMLIFMFAFNPNNFILFYFVRILLVFHDSMD